MTSRMKTLAEHGARIRLSQLVEEQRAIRDLFPDLNVESTSPRQTKAQKSHWSRSAKGRAKLSRLMKARWALIRRETKEKA